MKILTKELLVEGARLAAEKDASERAHHELLAAWRGVPEHERRTYKARLEASLKGWLAAEQRYKDHIAETSDDGEFRQRPYGAGLHDGVRLLTDVEIEERLGASQLPSRVVDHLRRCMEAPDRRWNRTLEALREDSDAAIGAMLETFRRCSEITGFSDDELVRRTDFKSADLHHDRLDSMFGELRAIVVLSNLGMESIEPLAAVKGRRRADLLTTRRGRKYAFDVFTPTASSSKWLADLVAGLIEKQDEKASQLATTRTELGCDASGLVYVLNADRPVVFEARADYIAAAEKILAALGVPPDTYVVMMTGRATTVSGREGTVTEPDDVIVPPLDDDA